MTAIIVSTPLETRPYIPPRLESRVCPWRNEPCAGAACPAWRGALFGCGLMGAEK